MQNEATSASAINRVVPVETSLASPESHRVPAPGGQLEALRADGSAQASTTPPAAGASEPPGSEPSGSNARARGQRVRPRERAASGARARDARASARERPESAGALRVGVGVRARGGPRLVWAGAASEAAAPQSRGDARAWRSGSGRLRSGRGAPAGQLGLAAGRLAGAGRFPGPEWPPPRETRGDTGLGRRGPRASAPFGPVRPGCGAAASAGAGAAPPGPASEVSAAPLGPSRLAAAARPPPRPELGRRPAFSGERQAGAARTPGSRGRRRATNFAFYCS